MAQDTHEYRQVTYRLLPGSRAKARKLAATAGACRIDCIEGLAGRSTSGKASRDRIPVKVDRQFTTDDARTKLKRLHTTSDE